MTPGSKILIVEDDRDARDVLADLLAREGFQVEVAADAVDAIHTLEMHRDEPPRVILLDLLMPGILGGSLLDYLREEPELAGVRIAIVSGSPHLAPDGYPVFAKPVDLSRLIEFLHDGRPRAAA
ncbi:MAG: response regulator [Deltaproteobacteria bacterium]|nr:response regulator [Deltaproteobacteria bacterium]